MAEKLRRRAPVWSSLGARAYFRTFLCGHFGCAGGGRDFSWLTLLLALVLSMALLLVGTRAGLLERFTDALLGTIRPYGVPVWTTAHWQNHGGIQSSLLEKLQELEPRIPGESFGITVHPYRRIERNSTPQVTMPQETIWDGGVPWLGWAIYPNNPLWLLGSGLEDRFVSSDGNKWLGLPLTLIVSEALFETQFDYDAYKETIQPVLKEKKLRRLPDKPPKGQMKNNLDSLWLKIQIGDRYEWVPFQLRWVHHIPAMEKVAFLFPLSTFNALLAVYHFPEILYDPLAQGKSDSRQHRGLTSSTYPHRELLSFAQCVSREVESTGLTDVPEIRSDRCPKPELPKGLGKVAGELATKGWDVLDHDSSNHLWLPCHRLPRSDVIRSLLCPDWDENSGGTPIHIPWDVTSYGAAFEAVHVYVPDPTKITKGINSVLAIRTADSAQALSIHPMYQDALNRFNLLSDLLSTMVPAYALTFGVFLGALLLAQVGALIGHRRHHYGILLSRGFTCVGLYAKLTWQMTLATLVASGIAVLVIIPVLRFLLEEGFFRIISRYHNLLPPEYHFEVLPLPWQTILVTTAEVFAVVVIVTVFLLFRLPLRGNTAPSDLLHGDGRAPRHGRRKLS